MMALMQGFRPAVPLVALFAAAAASRPLEAHIPTLGAGTAATVAIREEKVLIEFDLSFADMWGQAEMVTMDSDRDGAVGESEAEAFMRRAYDERIAPFLEVRLDGDKLPLVRVRMREENLTGEIAPVPFSVYYNLEAELPPGITRPGVEHRLEIENHSLKRESPALPLYYVPIDPESHARGISFLVHEPPEVLDLTMGRSDMRTHMGRKFVVTFSFTEGVPPARGEETPEAAAPAAQPQARLAQPPRDPPQPEDRFLNQVRDGLIKGNLTIWQQLFFILLAMAYGAGHAFAPGHGKTVVAAYLVGSKGRVTDAVVLGLATTLSHTLSVFIAGLAVHLSIQFSAAASSVALRNRIVVGTSLLSGLLLLVMGLCLFFRRWRYAGNPEAMAHHHHHHHHGHGHEQGHEHDHGHDPLHGAHAHDHHHHHHLPPGTKPTFWSLLGLGITGGMVPCPAGLVVILLGMQYQALLFALLLLVFFSLALGAVLVALGIFVVTGWRLFEGRFKLNARVLSYLPALSALLIAGLGTYFTVQSYRTGRTEVAAMLEALGSWVRG